MTSDPSATRESKLAKRLAVALVALFPITLVAAIVMVVLGRPSNELIALIGLLVTEAVVLVGVLLRDSADYRTYTLASADSARTHERAREAEKRLLMDTTLKGVELISIEEPAARNSAALLALDALGRVEFAVALLSGLWPKEQVNPEAASQLINSALASGDERLQRSAAAILVENATATYPGIGTVHYMPDQVQDWNIHLPERVRLAFTAYFAQVIRHLTIDGKATGPDTFHHLGPVIISLRTAARQDPSPLVRSNALTMLMKVVPLRSLLPGVTYLAATEGDFSLGDLEAWVRQEMQTSVAPAIWYQQWSLDMDQWWADRQAGGP